LLLWLIPLGLDPPSAPLIPLVVPPFRSIPPLPPFNHLLSALSPSFPTLPLLPQSPVEAYLDQLLSEVREDAVAAGFKARVSGWGEQGRGCQVLGLDVGCWE